MPSPTRSPRNAGPPRAPPATAGTCPTCTPTGSGSARRRGVLRRLAWTIGADGTDRIPVGYADTLIDTWNGWAVFSSTRPVAEAILADQHQHRREHRDALRAQGLPEPDLDAHVDAALTNLWFDGDVIVADQRAQYDDPEAIDHIRPDAAGRYVVMGWNWCWEPVDPTSATASSVISPSPTNRSNSCRRPTPAFGCRPTRTAAADHRRRHTHPPARPPAPAARRRSPSDP
jgi:hypothetical protein